eukprot:4306652-Pleurochrysis_carterae.AAC.3
MCGWRAQPNTGPGAGHAHSDATDLRRLTSMAYVHHRGSRCGDGAWERNHGRKRATGRGHCDAIARELALMSPQQPGGLAEKYFVYYLPRRAGERANKTRGREGAGVGGASTLEQEGERTRGREAA